MTDSLYTSKAGIKWYMVNIGNMVKMFKKSRETQFIFLCLNKYSLVIYLNRQDAHKHIFFRSVNSFFFHNGI